MAIPLAVTRFNKAVGNKALIHLAGHGPFVELEHVGRKSGRVYRIPVMAFRRGDRVTFALTYGSRVDWLRNVRAAKGSRIRMGRQWLTLGAPADLPRGDGLARMPAAARVVLRAAGVSEFVEQTILEERRVAGA